MHTLDIQQQYEVLTRDINKSSLRYQTIQTIWSCFSDGTAFSPDLLMQVDKHEETYNRALAVFEYLKNKDTNTILDIQPHPWVLAIQENYDPDTWLPRPYQDKALAFSMHNIDLWLQWKPLSTSTYDHTILLDMTMSSGKTVVVGNILSYFALADVVERIWSEKLSILLVSDKIDTINNQIQSLFGEETHILPVGLRQKFHHHTIHFKSTQKFEEDKFQSSPYTFVGSTFHSLDKPLIDKINTLVWGFDVIWVDEAHHLWADTWRQLVDQYNVPKNGRKPLMIWTTGTATAQLKELVGGGYTYSLAEYLLSPYCPEINYTIVTNRDVSQEQILAVRSCLEKIYTNAGMSLGRREFMKLMHHLEAMVGDILPSFDSLESLVDDILFRLGGDLAWTVYFVDSKKEADDLNKVLKKKTKQKSMTYYSGYENDNGALEYFMDQTLEQMIVIGKLDESIHPPKVKNLVGLSKTKSLRKILQRLGRFLGSNEPVYCWDYSGSFHYLMNIYELGIQMSQIKDTLQVTDNDLPQNLAVNLFEKDIDPDRWTSRDETSNRNVVRSKPSTTSSPSSKPKVLDKTGGSSSEPQNKLHVYLPHIVGDSYVNSSQGSDILSNGAIYKHLSGLQYVKPTITREDIQMALDDGSITLEDLEKKNWPLKAKKLNEDYPKTGKKYPLDRYELIQHLWGDPLISMGNHYLYSLIEGRKYVHPDKPFASTEVLLNYYIDGLFGEKELSHHLAWMAFAINHNLDSQTTHSITYSLDVVREKFLWRGKKDNNKLFLTFEELKNTATTGKRFALKADYEKLFQKWILSQKILTESKWPSFVKKRNADPKSRYMLYTQLTHVHKMLDTPFADGMHHSLSRMRGLAIGTWREISECYIAWWFDFDVTDLEDYNANALRWNVEHSNTYGFYLPLGFRIFQGIMSVTHRPEQLKKYLEWPFTMTPSPEEYITFIKKWIIDVSRLDEETWATKAKNYNDTQSAKTWYVMHGKLRSFFTYVLDMGSVASFSLPTAIEGMKEIFAYLVANKKYTTSKDFAILKEQLEWSLKLSATKEQYMAHIASWDIDMSWLESGNKWTEKAKAWNIRNPGAGYLLHTRAPWFINTLLGYQLSASKKYNLETALEEIKKLMPPKVPVDRFSIAEDTIQALRTTLEAQYKAPAEYNDYVQAIKSGEIVASHCSSDAWKKLVDKRNTDPSKTTKIALDVRSFVKVLLKLKSTSVFNLDTSLPIAQEVIKKIKMGETIADNFYTLTAKSLTEGYVTPASKEQYMQLMNEGIIDESWFSETIWRQKATNRNTKYSIFYKFTINPSIYAAANKIKWQNHAVKMPTADCRSILESSLLEALADENISSLWNTHRKEISIHNMVMESILAQNIKLDVSVLIEKIREYIITHITTLTWLGLDMAVFGKFCQWLDRNDHDEDVLRQDMKTYANNFLDHWLNVRMRESTKPTPQSKWGGGKRKRPQGEKFVHVVIPSKKDETFAVIEKQTPAPLSSPLQAYGILTPQELQAIIEPCKTKHHGVDLSHSAKEKLWDLFSVVKKSIDYALVKDYPYEAIHNSCIRHIVYDNTDAVEKKYTPDNGKIILDSNNLLLIKEYIVVLYNLYDKLRSDLKTTLSKDKPKHIEFVQYANEIKKKLLGYHFDIDAIMLLDSNTLGKNAHIKEIVAELQSLVELTHMY